MNSKHAIRLALCLYFLAASPQAIAQTDAAKSLQWAMGRCQPYALEVATELKKGLTPTDRQTLERVSIECKFNLGFGAAAGLENGKPIIALPAGTIVALELTGTASALGSAYGKPLCGAIFMDYMAEAASKNVDRMLRGESPLPGKTVFEFARTERTYCPSVSEAEFRANPAAADGREFLINGGLRFILAHELGHHVLGHVKSAPDNAIDSRRRERDADSFALKAVGKAGYSPMDSVLALGLLAAYDDYSARDPRAATHPAGSARLATLAEAFKLLLREPEMREYVNESPDRRHLYAKALESFEAMAEGLE